MTAATIKILTSQGNPLSSAAINANRCMTVTQQYIIREGFRQIRSGEAYLFKSEFILSAFFIQVLIGWYMTLASLPARGYPQEKKGCNLYLDP